MFLRVLWQIALIAIFWGLGNALAMLLHSTMPGSIWGILLLFCALFFNLIKLEQVEEGASAILKELVVLFLPLVMTVMQYKKLFITEGWKLLISIGVGTALVMISTSFTIHLMYRFKKRGAL